MTTPRQRVVFVLPTLQMGGAERVLITLMNGLDRSRFDCHIIVIDNNGLLKDWIANSISFHSLGNLKIRYCLPKLVRKINDLEPDIIVSTMAAMNFSVLLAKPFLKKKSRIIVREAVIPSSIIEFQKFPVLVKLAYKNLYPHADLVLSPAQVIIDEFANYLKMDTSYYTVLHNPVDAKKIMKETVLPSVTEQRQKIVHFVASGRLHPQKGFDRLIETLPKLSHRNWQLKILGIGPEQEKLQALIDQNNLNSHVSLAGLFTNPWPHYAAADAFLLPSRWEGLPNVALEALAVGTPVIATKESGGIHEIANFTDKITIVDDMNVFLHAMEQVTPNPTKEYRPSLLPQQFQLETVLKRFEELLTGANP